jgi:VIT1/CCC1 family predicted Fe2+/Mn2+ transporter
MSARRRYMARTNSAVEQLVVELGMRDPQRSAVYSAVGKYNRECGCTLGGLGFVGALVSVAAYAALTHAVSLAAIGAEIALVFTAAIAGKIVGLLVASLRLGWLRRSLARRVARLPRRGHVCLH